MLHIGLRLVNRHLHPNKADGSRGLPAAVLLFNYLCSMKDTPISVYLELHQHLKEVGFMVEVFVLHAIRIHAFEQ